MQIAYATAAESAALKLEDLNLRLRELLRGGLVVAFSGGVDSTFLLWAAEEERRRSGGKLLALTTVSDSLAAVERDDVRRFIDEFEVDHIFVESNELLDPRYAVNDASRCFYCKTELFRICREAAESNGYASIAYGYNASDRGDIRPGHNAAIENGILSPLADAQLTKSEIRDLMREHGLSIAEKPASPCLSSRLMTGVQITPAKLREVDAIETILRDNGIKVFRVRFHEIEANKFLRIEVQPDEMERAFALREQLTSAGRKLGFRWVTLDLAGYTTGGGNLQNHD